VRNRWPRGPERQIAMSRLRDRRREGQTDRWGGDGQMDSRWDAHGTCHVGEAGGWRSSGRQAPLPIVLGTGRHRAGPDPAGSLWGGGESGGGATPTGPRLPASQVPASAAGPWEARVQGGLGLAEHHPSACLSLRYQSCPGPQPSLPVSPESEESSGLGWGDTHHRALVYKSATLGPQHLLSCR
jgi:hypothetical protein